MERMGLDDVKKMFGHIADAVMAQETLLTEIDEKIGDGDHGIGMARGFLAVKERLPMFRPDSVNELFKEVGMILLDAMGGASGVIFGTMFISGCGAVSPKAALSIKELAPMMKRSLEKIKERGGAEVGDKTMVDSYEPAVEALLAAEQKGSTLEEALKAAKEAAQKGASGTKDYGARRGRAESYGDQSRGFPDPGAVSVGIIMDAMYQYVNSLAQAETTAAGAVRR